MTPEEFEKIMNRDAWMLKGLVATIFFVVFMQAWIVNTF